MQRKRYGCLLCREVLHLEVRPRLVRHSVAKSIHVLPLCAATQAKVIQLHGSDWHLQFELLPSVVALVGLLRVAVDTFLHLCPLFLFKTGS